MNESSRSTLKALALTAFILGFWVYWNLPAFSHEWYSKFCCNEFDCRPLLESEYRITDEGYFIVPSGMMVPFGDKRIKPSADAGIHACFISGEPKNGVRCLYVPTGV